MLKLTKILKKINEEVIGKYRKKIDIVYAIDKTKHANDRQSRGEFIPDSAIKDLTNRSIDKVAAALIHDEIDINKQYVHLQDTKSDLNIIGKPEEDGNRIKFVIVTIMKKKGFKAKSGTKTIMV